MVDIPSMEAVASGVPALAAKEIGACQSDQIDFIPTDNYTTEEIASIIYFIAFASNGTVAAMYDRNNLAFIGKKPVSDVSVSGVGGNLLNFHCPDHGLYHAVNNPTGIRGRLSFVNDSEGNGPDWYFGDVQVIDADNFTVTGAHAYGAVDGVDVPQPADCHIYTDGFTGVGLNLSTDGVDLVNDQLVAVMTA